MQFHLMATLLDAVYSLNRLMPDAAGAPEVGIVPFIRNLKDN